MYYRTSTTYKQLAGTVNKQVHRKSAIMCSNMTLIVVAEQQRWKFGGHLALTCATTCNFMPSKTDIEWLFAVGTCTTSDCRPYS